ncbi:MAG: hypothetical protein RM338_29425 [Nostoc sp. DedQUE12a]|nr:hypothetical protein [Nostoc sp. DedQUE12a]
MADYVVNYGERLANTLSQAKTNSFLIVIDLWPREQATGNGQQ